MAKRALDQILVVDVESTCWQGPAPAGQVSEIIEIGVCPLDIATLEPQAPRALMVRPTRSEISAFCTELTTITATDVEGAPTLGEACAVLRQEFNSRNRYWASFGDYDRHQFKRNCSDLGIGYPFSTRHLNVKSLFSLVRGLKREVGMARALELSGIELSGTHHRGVDDAFNIAKLLAQLLAASREEAT